MPKVQCIGCKHYDLHTHKGELLFNIGQEPRGMCNNEIVTPSVDVCTYTGKNWRINHRNSETRRYCKGYEQGDHQCHFCNGDYSTCGYDRALSALHKCPGCISGLIVASCQSEESSNGENKK